MLVLTSHLDAYNFFSLDRLFEFLKLWGGHSYIQMLKMDVLIKNVFTMYFNKNKY